MHRLITCDDVFEILTRGPFPTGQSIEDSEVEVHLSGCHDCRRLAEALRPATGLLRESLTEDDLPVHGLPMFQGSMLTAGNVHVPPPWCEADVAPAAHPRATSLWLSHAARLMAAAMIIGLLVGAVQLVAAMKVGEPSAAQLREHLATAPMPSQCRLALLEGSRDDAARENCCSSCHSAAAVKPNGRAPIHRLVATSCRSCHE